MSTTKLRNWALIGLIGLSMLAALLLLQDMLLAAHLDRAIEYISSDAATYYELYSDFYADLDLSENPVLFMIGSPILFMKLAGGHLLVVQLCNLILMVLTLKTALGCFRSAAGRRWFLVGTLAFPYFLFGFLSLNKEVYAMCSAILFCCYHVRGRWSDLLFALVLACCARYYMMVALVVLVVLVPRQRPPRYALIVALLLFISVAAPIGKSLVPQYSGEDLLEAPSGAGLFFAAAINSYAYALVYPLKYAALIPMRAYSFLLNAGRVTDAMEGVVSLLSLAAMAGSSWVLVARRTSDLVRRLIVSALVAPIPMMWSEIMHWRYYSYVYLFMLFALILHYTERDARPAAPTPSTQVTA